MSLPVWRPDLQIRPSRIGCCVFGVLVLATCVWVSVWQIPLLWRAGLLAVLLGYARSVWRRAFALTDRRAIQHIRQDDAGWYLHTRTTEMGLYRLASDTWLQSAFIWLVWEGLPGDPVKPQRVLLWPDSLSRSDYRRLQGYLRWQDPTALTPQPADAATQT